MSGIDYLQFVLALVFVLSILGLCAMAVRRYGGIGPGMKAARLRRLQIVEMLALDQKRKLWLLRQDGQEFLILSGPTGDLLLKAEAARDIKGQMESAA